MVSNIFNQIIEKFSKAGIPSPRLEARILLAHVLSEPVSAINPGTINLNSSQKAELEKMIQERLSHKPLCKITGSKDFYKNSFIVSEAVLSPRPDTEILVEEAIKIATINRFNNVLDLGTGSGCILLSILKDCPSMNGVGVDASAAALAIAQKNSQTLGLDSTSSFINASWFDSNFSSKLGAKFDLIVSNPPYIPSSDIDTLDAEVKNYDPKSALDGGSDGYKDYRQLALIIPDLLSQNGHVLLEVGINQSQKVAEIFTAKGLTLVSILPDLSGIERCVVLKK